MLAGKGELIQRRAVKPDAEKDGERYSCFYARNPPGRHARSVPDLLVYPSCLSGYVSDSRAQQRIAHGTAEQATITVLASVAPNSPLSAAIPRVVAWQRLTGCFPAVRLADKP